MGNEKTQPTEPSEQLRFLRNDRQNNAVIARERADYAEAVRLAGGQLVHGASKLHAPSVGNEMLVTPCGGVWPLALKDSASRQPEALIDAEVTCLHCRAVLGLGARLVTFTATLPVGNPDRGAEQDVVVAAAVDMSDERDLTDSVLFIEPTLAELQDFHADDTIDRLAEDAVALASVQAKREQDRAEDAAVLAEVARGFGGGL